MTTRCMTVGALVLRSRWSLVVNNLRGKAALALSRERGITVGVASRVPLMKVAVRRLVRSNEWQNGGPPLSIKSIHIRICDQGQTGHMLAERRTFRGRSRS